jgi:glucose-1-phosphate adenylyltransferase
MRNVLGIVLGGGQGTRLFPLTAQRSKPAVPIGGNYRLIDIPVSNCLHADVRRIFVLTQFNSASLNRHIAQTYRMDLFSHGFVEVLAAELTPESSAWYQGTADAVRRAARHFARYDADLYLILSGDQLYRMDYGEMIEAHVDGRADITIAAQPVSVQDASSMGVFMFDRSGQIAAFEEKPNVARLQVLGQSIPAGTLMGRPTPDKPFVASMGVYLFTRDVLLDLMETSDAKDFGREVIPQALGRYRVGPFLFRDYWADVGTVASFYDANLMLTRRDAPFQFYDAHRPIYTHPRFLPGSRLTDCAVRDAIVTEGCQLERCTIEESVVGIRTQIHEGTTVRRSVLLGADFYESDAGLPRPRGVPPLGLGRGVVLDRVIVDKNARIGDGARLVNEQGLETADGKGYYIREGIIIVPKDGVIPPGTVV